MARWCVAGMDAASTVDPADVELHQLRPELPVEVIPMARSLVARNRAAPDLSGMPKPNAYVYAAMWRERVAASDAGAKTRWCLRRRRR